MGELRLHIGMALREECVDTVAVALGRIRTLERVHLVFAESEACHSMKIVEFLRRRHRNSPWRFDPESNVLSRDGPGIVTQLDDELRDADSRRMDRVQRGLQRYSAGPTTSEERQRLRQMLVSGIQRL